MSSRHRPNTMPCTSANSPSPVAPIPPTPNINPNISPDTSPTRPAIRPHVRRPPERQRQMTLPPMTMARMACPGKTDIRQRKSERATPINEIQMTAFAGHRGLHRSASKVPAATAAGT